MNNKQETNKKLTDLLTYAGVKFSGDVFNEEFERIQISPKTIYEKVCAVCGKTFDSTRLNKNICSFSCRKEHNRQHSKLYARMKRNNNNGNFKDSCVICGFNETIDRHREGNIVIVLCPNHHCLITRGIKTLKELIEQKSRA